VDQAACKELPYIVAFLSQTVWEDGKDRKPGSILVVADGGLWKCWVNDRDALLSAWVSADTLLDLLSAVERGLAGDALSWRSDRKGKR
jgi:hypothetical protein